MQGLVGKSCTVNLDLFSPRSEDIMISFRDPDACVSQNCEFWEFVVRYNGDFSKAAYDIE